MTTSLLNTHVRDSLCDNDIQTLRDYALEAPWNWRVLFEELADMAENYDTMEYERDEAVAKYEEMEEGWKDKKTQITAAAEKMKRQVEKLELGRQKGNLTKGDLDVITEGIREALEGIVDEVK